MDDIQRTALDLQHAVRSVREAANLIQSIADSLDHATSLLTGGNYTALAPPVSGIVQHPSQSNWDGKVPRHTIKEDTKAELIARDGTSDSLGPCMSFDGTEKPFAESFERGHQGGRRLLEVTRKELQCNDGEESESEESEEDSLDDAKINEINAVFERKADKVRQKWSTKTKRKNNNDMLQNDSHSSEEDTSSDAENDENNEMIQRFKDSSQRSTISEQRKKSTTSLGKRQTLPQDPTQNARLQAAEGETRLQKTK